MARFARILSAFALGLMCLGTAQATLVGTTVLGALDAFSPGGTSLASGSAVVGAGVEFPFTFPSGAPITANFAETTLELSFTARSASIGGDVFWSFTLDPLLKFDTISEVTDTYVNGASLVSFHDNVAIFKIANQSNTVGTTYSALYNIAVSAVVPEPSLLALVGLGLIGVALTTKRK